MNNKDKETFETWNKVASIYQDKFMDFDLYNHTYDFVCNSIKKNNAQILDIGCGPGNITKYLLSKHPDFEIFGIDIAPNMIELAIKNNPTAHFKVMDTREIGQIQSNYDAIICGFCLPYLSQTEAATLIADCVHLLNKDGLLYISFVEGAPNKSGFVTNNMGDRVYFNYHDISVLRKQLTDNKLVELKTFFVEFKRSESIMEIHTILIAKKNLNDKA